MEAYAIWKLVAWVAVSFVIISATLALAAPILSSILSETEALTRDGLGLMEQDDDDGGNIAIGRRHDGTI